jgi:ribosomal protein L11
MMGQAGVEAFQFCDPFAKRSQNARYRLQLAVIVGMATNPDEVGQLLNDYVVNS